MVHETQIVKQTQVVKQTVVVEREKVITPTAPAGLVTPHGRSLPSDAAPLDKQVLYEQGSEPKHLDVSRDIYGAGPALNWGSEPLLRRDQDQNIVRRWPSPTRLGPTPNTSTS